MTKAAKTIGSFEPTPEQPLILITVEACLAGGELAGAYADSIGKTDLAQMTAEEWSIFCNRLVGGAFIHAGNLAFGDDPPF